MEKDPALTERLVTAAVLAVVAAAWFMESRSPLADRVRTLQPFAVWTAAQARDRGAPLIFLSLHQPGRGTVDLIHVPEEFKLGPKDTVASSLRKAGAASADPAAAAKAVCGRLHERLFSIPSLGWLDLGEPRFLYEELPSWPSGEPAVLYGRLLLAKHSGLAFWKGLPRELGRPGADILLLPAPGVSGAGVPPPLGTGSGLTAPGVSGAGVPPPPGTGSGLTAPGSAAAGDPWRPVVERLAHSLELHRMSRKTLRPARLPGEEALEPFLLRLLGKGPEQARPSDRPITVEVLNGTPLKGIATGATKVLRLKGADVLSLGNAEGASADTLVYDRTGRFENALSVRDMLGCPEAQAVTDIRGRTLVEVSVVVGEDCGGRFDRRPSGSRPD